MKKGLVSVLMLVCLIAPLLVTACGGSGGGRSSFVVMNREAGSGTRATFEERVMTWINEAGQPNSKQISIKSEQYDSNPGILNAVSPIENGIGYVSVGFLPREGVKAVTINGIECTVENVLNGSYPISRVLYFITKDEADEAEKAFIYWCQNDGQQFVEDERYIPLPDDYTFLEIAMTAKPGYQTGSDAILDVTGGWTPNTLEEGGSTTVLPLAERWSVEYKKAVGRTVIPAGGGSGTGTQGTYGGTYDIGAISRDLFTDERNGLGLIPYDIALDGIAIVVSTHVYDDLGITNLTLEELREIFATGTGALIPVR